MSIGSDATAGREGWIDLRAPDVERYLLVLNHD
jgi:hypothetical protein